MLKKFLFTIIEEYSPLQLMQVWQVWLQFHRRKKAFWCADVDDHLSNITKSMQHIVLFVFGYSWLNDSMQYVIVSKAPSYQLEHSQMTTRAFDISDSQVAWQLSWSKAVWRNDSRMRESRRDRTHTWHLSPLQAHHCWSNLQRKVVHIFTPLSKIKPQYASLTRERRHHLSNSADP